MIEKPCAKCKEIKPLDQFSRHRSAKDGLQRKCKKCCMEWWYQHRLQQDPDYRPQRPRHKRIRKVAPNSHALRYRLRKYGVTGCDVTRMRIEQGDRCAICKVPEAEERLVIDHCHDSGRVRGLLCDSCNQGLGHFRDDPSRMTTAIAYLAPAA